MWNFISHTMVSRAVILTTHSMEECEALCSRLTIVVDGEMQAIGTTSHLKQRFGQGYQMDLSTLQNPATVQRLQAWVERTFPGSFVVESHGGLLKYGVPPQQMTFGESFP